MNEELEKILTNLSDAGCGSEEQGKARKFYEAGDLEALIRYFREPPLKNGALPCSPFSYPDPRPYI